MTESYDEPVEVAGSLDEPVEVTGSLDEPVEVPPAVDSGGDPRIAAAVARLDALGDAPAAEHVEVYEDVHRVLQDALADAAQDGEQQS